jgi:uncharacterized protein YukE
MQAGNNFMGMNIEEVRATADSMQRAARTINDVVARLTQSLSSTDWRGPDAERFRSAWDSAHAPNLRRAADDVTSSTSQVRSHIEAQIRVSQTH